jgi:5-formyltetrahydrofolate cyclo-ligase
VRQARTVLGYASFGDEVDVDPLLAELRARGVRVQLPFVTTGGLETAEVPTSSDLVSGYRGVREPSPDGRVVAEARDVDVAIVPGVAFDPTGARLGYGGGHFDRLLPRLRPDAVLVGVAYAVQVVDVLPVEAHDPHRRRTTEEETCG